jgi:hypothetical protein
MNFEVLKRLKNRTIIEATRLRKLVPSRAIQRELNSTNSKIPRRLASATTFRKDFTVEQLPTQVVGDIVEEYEIGEARVTIADESGHGRYIISEPRLTEVEESFYSILMHSLYFSMDPIPNLQDPARYIENYIWQAAEEKGIVDQVKRSYPK